MKKRKQYFTRSIKTVNTTVIAPGRDPLVFQHIEGFAPDLSDTLKTVSMCTGTPVEQLVVETTLTDERYRMTVETFLANAEKIEKQEEK